MKLREFLNHNRYQTISTILVCFVLVWIYACESTVPSITNPNIKVGRDLLTAELDHYLAQADIRFAQLNRQDELKQTLFEHTTLWATTGTVNPLGVLLSIGALLGVGSATDNVRKRIKGKKARPATTNQ